MAEPFEIEVNIRNKRFRSAEKGLLFLGSRLNKGLKDAPRAFKRELKTYLDATAKAMEQRHGGAWPQGTTRNTLSRRSGKMLRSIKKSVRVRGTTFETVIGEIGGVSWLKTHESGATIRPKKAKYLAIPLPPALNKRGVPKKKGPKDWPNTFVTESKKGNLIIFQKVGKKKIVPLYVLKKEVRIPPRLGLRDTLQAGRKFFIDRAVDRMLRTIVPKGTAA